MDFRNFGGLSGKSVFDVLVGGGVDHNVAIFYVNLKYLKMTFMCKFWTNDFPQVANRIKNQVFWTGRLDKW